MKIKCDECGEFLMETNLTSKSAIGIHIQKAGYIYKNACLFSDKYTSLYFCNKDCQKAFYDENIPRNEEVSKVLRDMKKDIPNMAKECRSGLAELSKQFNKFKNKQ